MVLQNEPVADPPPPAQDERAEGIAAWIVTQGLRGARPADLLEGLCRKLVGTGVPLMRFHIAQSAMHPVYGSIGFDWHRNVGTVREANYLRTQQPLDAWLRSPLYHMLKNGLFEFRARLSDIEGPSEFPIFDDFREHGGTDYFACATLFALDRLDDGLDANNPPEGMLTSWTSDAPDGFSSADIALIQALLPVVGLALKSASNYRTAQDLLTVYLGRDAGRRVHSGEIQRGTLQSIRAVIWYFDLKGFTKLAESTPPTDLVDMLNDYFGTAVGVVHENGGDVLKFMGDGLLAIFNPGDDTQACRSAIAACEQLLDAVAQVNSRREAEARPTTTFTLAMHLGDVMYGNIGAPERLDFTVIGPAVNMAARMESMSGPLERAIVLSSAVVAAAGDRGDDRIVSLGRYMLRGVPEPQELFTLI